MSQSTTVITKKRGPKPTGKGTLVGVRIQPDLLADLDEYRRTLGMTRPEAIRDILDDYLMERDD